MKPIHALALLSLALVLVVSGCQGSNPLDPPNCRNGACIRMELLSSSGTPLGTLSGSTQTAPAGVGQLFTVALTIESPADVSDLTIFFSTDRPTVALIEGEKQWKLNVKSRQAATISSQVRFTQEGYATFYGTLVTKDSERAATTMTVHVTPTGVTPNPTVPGAGTHEPIPATIIFGASPFPTDIPTSTIPPPTPTRPPYS